MACVPLDNVLLRLRTMVGSGESVADLLAEALEPPDAGHVQAALEKLVALGMLDGSDALGGLGLDTAPLTALGGLAAALPLDPPLSRLVFFGLVLGVAAEAL
eukprot:5692281-Prymnesium_polylepis.1